MIRRIFWRMMESWSSLGSEKGSREDRCRHSTAPKLIVKHWWRQLLRGSVRSVMFPILDPNGGAEDAYRGKAPSVVAAASPRMLKAVAVTRRETMTVIFGPMKSHRESRCSNTSWECKQCSFDNFATELQCFMCQAVRPNWQWLKMYQSKSTIHAAGAESASVATRSPQDALVKADNECKSSDSTIQNHNADAISYITGQPTSFSTSGNNAEYNYYGDCSDGISYAHISIHYDFNQAYYKNHDYSYLNQGINSNRKYSNSGNNKAISGGNIRSSGVKNMREKVESNWWYCWQTASWLSEFMWIYWLPFALYQ